MPMVGYGALTRSVKRVQLTKRQAYAAIILIFFNPRTERASACVASDGLSPIINLGITVTSSRQL